MAVTSTWIGEIAKLFFFILQSKLGLVNGSYHGSYQDGILSCTFIKYKAINVSNSEAYKVANLMSEYYIFLGIGPVNSSGKRNWNKNKHKTILVGNGYTSL